MDRSEAIKILKEANAIDLTSGDTKGRQAIDLAMEALQDPTVSEDCISREWVLKLYKEWQPTLATNVYEFGDALKNAPSVAPTERTGEWIGLDECSVCGKQAYDFIEGCVEGVEYLPNYCPNCGAKMGGDPDLEYGGRAWVVSTVGCLVIEGTVPDSL